MSSLCSTFPRSGKICSGGPGPSVLADELRTIRAATSLRAIRFGSLDFVANDLGTLQLSTKEQTRSEDTILSPSVGKKQYELASGMRFVGVADYASPSLHNILEAEPDDAHSRGVRI